MTAVKPLPPDWQPRFLEKCWPACQRRKDAMLDGGFTLDFKRDGWVFPDYYVSGILFHDCPFCGGELPTVADVTDRIIHSDEDDQC